MTPSFELFRSSPLATSLCRVADRCVIDVNDAFLALLAVSRSDIVGRTPVDVGMAMRDGLLERLGAGDRVDDLEVEIHTMAGPKTLLLWSRPVEIDGALHALSTFIDITERKRTASAATLNDERMRELAENIHEVFWLTDPENTRMLYVSPAYERIFGRPAPALYVKALDWLNALHPEDRARMSTFTATPTIAERRDHFRVVHADGLIRAIEIKVFPVRDKAGAVIRVAGVAEDITERLQLEEQVRQTQKLESLGLLAGGVAHDFNNILAVVACNTSLLAEYVLEGHPDHELIDEIAKAVRRATALTQQLLAFSRKQVVEPVVLDLNATVNDTRKMLRRMVGEDVVVATSLEPELCRVLIDPGYLVQVLMNLAVNARDAMPRGGALTITTRNCDSTREVLIQVSDTGSGMTAAVKARVFEPFFTTKGVGKGTGLGLSVVHGIVQQAGGRLEIDSELGVGTTFRVFLPVEEAPIIQRADVATASSRGNEKVVIVDDDAHVRRSISRVLRGCGYEVMEAADGQAALMFLGDHGTGADLLVTDVVMPGMDGRELVDTARRRRPSLRVLYMSGYTDDAVLHHGVERAEVALIEKPFRGHALAGRVREILDDLDARIAATIPDRRS